MWEYLLLVVGLVILVVGADFLVKGASALAKKLNVPVLVIGLTVVAFGTSMPELIVNIWASSTGATDVAIGTIIGSNLANTLLILGMAALIYSIKVKKTTVWKEIPFSVLAAVVLLVLVNDIILDGTRGLLSRVDGVILLLFFLIFMYYTYELAIKREVHAGHEIEPYKPHTMAFMILGGTVGLFFGGNLVVNNAVTIATNLGVSQFIISATIIAIGTSLPELVTSIVAALKKNVDMAVGNIIGSNIFNIFMVLGISSIINPIPFAQYINFDLIMVIFATSTVFVFAAWGGRKKLMRWQGALLVMFYIFYLILISIRG